MMDRRALLRTSLAAALAPFTVRLAAAPERSSRLLIVFLRGGYDAANLLIPVGSRFYYEARPNIAVPKDSALPLDSEWGLHPVLRDTLYALYQRGEVAFVAFAGTDDLSRSHFETQDSIELGLSPGRGGGYSSASSIGLCRCSTRAARFRLPTSSRSYSVATPRWRTWRSGSPGARASTRARAG